MATWSNFQTLIGDAFDLQDLRILSVELRIDYEDLGEGIGKGERIARMVAHIGQHGRFEELLAALRRQRPAVAWPDSLTALPDLPPELVDLTAPEIPCRHLEPKTLYIPPGPFLLGSLPAEGVPAYETPRLEVTLPGYRIGLYPVTNAEFGEFVRQSGHLVPPEAGWSGQIAPEAKATHPVAGVSWYDALAYCRWLSTWSGRAYALPTEAQWEKAARGSDGRLYPWGNEWEDDRCHHEQPESATVDHYPAQSQFGAYDLVGNVREWTRSLWGARRIEPDDAYRYPAAGNEWREDDGRHDLQAGSHVRRAFRGGGAGDGRERLTCSRRGGYQPERPGPPGKRHGLRVVINLDAIWD